MKYRIVHRDRLYCVQYRHWWGWWVTDRHYESHKEPREVMRYGGFLSDIGYKDMEYGIHATWFYSQGSAERRIEELKAARRRRKEKKPEKQKVVYTDP